VEARSRIKVTVLLAALFCAAAAGGVAWYQVHAARAFFETRVLLSRFPPEDAMVVSIDFAAIRAAGLLSGSKAALEPDYQQFLEATGFDYRRDLQSAVASFSHSGTFFIARGRFDWKKLRDYAASHGGSCYRELCRMPGSTADRHISFVPLRNDAIGLAVSTNDLAATRLTQPGQAITGALPSAPVWISLPGAELRRPDALPPGMRLTLSALQTADRVVVTLGPGTPGIEAHLDATCHTKDDARVLASQLRSATALLKEALARDKKASSDELGAMLMAGTFDQADRRVTGRWPVPVSLIDALTAGI
jgi:hypothetical protein